MRKNLRSLILGLIRRVKALERRMDTLEDILRVWLPEVLGIIRQELARVRAEGWALFLVSTLIVYLVRPSSPLIDEVVWVIAVLLLATIGLFKLKSEISARRLSRRVQMGELLPSLAAPKKRKRRVSSSV